MFSITMSCISFLCMCRCGLMGLLLCHYVRPKNYVLLLNRTINILQRRSNLAVVRGCTKIRISRLRKFWRGGISLFSTFYVPMQVRHFQVLQFRRSQRHNVIIQTYRRMRICSGEWPTIRNMHCTGWSKKNGATLHFPKYLENY